MHRNGSTNGHAGAGGRSDANRRGGTGGRSDINGRGDTGGRDGAGGRGDTNRRDGANGRGGGNGRGGQARHVAIITDGNGRWAQARGLPPTAGHEAGADTLKARLCDAAELGIEELTVYSFSTENWSRPQAEVDGLIAMMAKRIAREAPELHREGVRMCFIGRRKGVSEQLTEQMDRAEALTRSNGRITLCVAFNYGGRAEILDAAVRFKGGTEEQFSRLLYAPEMHDPELIIRTGEERRLSNFVLWQAAYAELVFRDELWPDFGREALVASLREFSERARRFGGRTPVAGEPHHGAVEGVTTVFEREE